MRKSFAVRVASFLDVKREEMLMKKSFWLAVAILLTWNSCKNPDIQKEFPFEPPPPGREIPGPGTGDSPGGGGGAAGLAFTPFRPQIGALGNPGITSYSALVDIGMGFSLESGTLFLVLDGNGVHVFDSTGRQILLLGMPSGAVSVAAFEPYTDFFTVLFNNSTTIVFSIFGRVLAPAPYHFVLCDQETSNDWWTFASLGSGTDVYMPERLAISYDPNSSGEGPVGLEWDIYGNLWARMTALSVEPTQCQGTGPCGEAACPVIVVFMRGISGPNCTQTPATCLLWAFGPWVVTSTFTGVRLPCISCLWDFDFDSSNRMIFNQAQPDSIFITKPIPDYGEADEQGNPLYSEPLPIETIRIIEGTGVRSGPENPHFRLPWGIAVDRTDNTLLVGDVVNDRLVEFDSLGTFHRIYREGEVSVSRGATTKTFFGPVDAFFDPFGRIFVIDRGTDPQTGQAVEDLYIIFKRIPPDIIPGNVQGRVTDSVTGKPVELAQITLFDWNQNRITTTDVEGRYAFQNVLPGRHTITASKEGYFPETREFDLTSAQTITVDFALVNKTARHLLGSVSGRTVDDITGLPLDGVRVYDRETGKTDITHSGGIFRISDLPPGTHTLDFFFPPDYITETRIVQIVAGMDVNIGDVRMKRVPKP